MIARAEPAGWFRVAARGIGLMIAMLAAIPPHYLWRLLRQSSPWPRLFLGWAARICGARRKTIGVPLRRDVFFVANHVSWLDIPVIAGANGTAFIAKHELAKAPIVGWLAKVNRTVFVQRADRMGVAAQINELREALAQTWAITIFPEGTTTDGLSLLPFKPSLLAVLDPPPPGIMVQPVVLNYGAVTEEIAWVGVEQGQDNALRVLKRKGSFPVEVHFLEPFNPRDYPGRKAINAEARRRIEEALARTLGHPLRPFPGHDVLAAIAAGEHPPLPHPATPVAAPSLGVQ
ncbi:MAG: lysophospholipid acyltransferase family protein [Sphingomonas sp.]